MCHREGMAWGHEIGHMDMEINYDVHKCVKHEDCGKVFHFKNEKGTEWVEVICEEESMDKMKFHKKPHGHDEHKHEDHHKHHERDHHRGQKKEHKKFLQ